MRRWPSVINTTPATTATNITASSDQRLRCPSLPPLPPSSSDACCSKLPAGARHAGQNAGHDQQADAVADAEFVDLLAEPHQEDGAGGHRQHGDDLPAELQAASIVEKLRIDQVLRLDVRIARRTSFGPGKERRWRSACIR